MTISIWYWPEGGKAEVVDRASSPGTAAYLAHEYELAFSCGPGQHRYQKDYVWAGRKRDRPDNQPPR